MVPKEAEPSHPLVVLSFAFFGIWVRILSTFCVGEILLVYFTSLAGNCLSRINLFILRQIMLHLPPPPVYEKEVVKMGSYSYYADNNKEWQPLLGSDDDVGHGAKKCKFLNLLQEKVKKSFNELQDFAVKSWEMGRDDPQKIIFAMKMGLALSIVSSLIFWKGASADVSQYSIWAILTVIVMFEFTIGATFIKGFNRILGTICAGLLAFCFAELSLLVGKGEEVVIVTSIFIGGFFSSYLKLYPTMVPYEYGFRVFILTYCILMVAGNRTREYTEAVVTRLVLIAIGAGVCFLVNVFIYPIWAGDALHSLVVKNFVDLAASLEGCVNGYLKCVEYETIPSNILTFQAYDDELYNGYRSVVESASKENSLLGFSIWEPPHGRFRMLSYPWKNYIKVSDALRHCAFTVMALHGCILSEIQAPAEKRLIFSSELRRVGMEGANLLRELGKNLNNMKKLSPGVDMLMEVHTAAEQLQEKIDKKSYLLVNSESWEIAAETKEVQDVENLIDANHNEEEYESAQLGLKTRSEAVLNLNSIPVRNSSDFSLFRKQASLPSRISFNIDAVDEEFDSRTYESASALSLATFASLLIEFAARLRNVVDSFEELSEKGKFAEPAVMDSEIGVRKDRILVRFCRCFRY